MSDDEEVCRFGTPLDPIKEDEVPSKKPITLADQIAVDSNGRRRFHGAFTGGFSAGFWNTVGSAEGWKPQTFKSSRHEKAMHSVQKPNDFMDEEDVSEFGIAPQRIQTTEDFTPTDSGRDKTRSKRKILPPSEGPIPGVPVLHLVLESSHDKVAVRLLKRMLTKDRPADAKPKERKQKPAPVPEEVVSDEEQPATDTDKKVYKCDMGPMQKPLDEESESSESDDENVLTFQPDEFDAFVTGYKIDRFGLDYTGLDRNALLGGSGDTTQQKHLNLFSSFEMVDKNNKKISIKGQAFGVGAFEDDDDDIYAKDDMSSYDFRLEERRELGSSTSKAIQAAKAYISGFKDATEKPKSRNKIFYVDLPRNFEPRNWLRRRTRFGPAVEQLKDEEKQIVGRHDLTPVQRGAILNEKSKESKTKSDDVDSLLKAAGLKSMNFVTTTVLQPNDEEIQPRSISPGLVEKVDDVVGKLDNVIKSSKTSKEFQAPASLPLISDRFVSEVPETSTVKPEPQPKVTEKKEVKIVRTKIPWTPSQLLCYKMNIETAAGTAPDHKTSTFSLFSCLASGNEPKKRSLEFTNTGSFLSDNDNEKAKLDQLERNQATRQPPKPQVSDTSKSVPSTSSKIPTTVHTASSTSIESAVSLKSLPKKDTQVTELEQKIIDAQEKRPSEKIDIFKAIFEDSDDDEDDNVQKNKEMSLVNVQNVDESLSSKRMTSANFFDLPKTAEEMNILRNLSPPRGIFAGLIAKSNAAIEQMKKDHPEPSVSEVTMPADCYGPSLPPSIQAKKIISSEVSVESTSKAERSQQSNTKKLITESENGSQYKIYVEEKWVEKTSSSVKREKKSKKEKKHKKKNKKEKHKSSRHRSRSRSPSRSRSRKSRK